MATSDCMDQTGGVTESGAHDQTGDPTKDATTPTTLQPNSYKDRLLAEAESLEREGKLTEAVALYQQLIRQDPSSVSAWNNLGSLFASLKDWGTARIFLNEAERLNPRNAIVCNNQGNVLDRCGEGRASLEKYHTAVGLEPANALFRNNLGNALRKAGEWDAAEGMLLSAIALRRDYPAAYANLAYLRYEQARLGEAEQLYRTAIQFDPSYAMAHTCLGQLLLSRGAFREGWKEMEWRWKWEDFPSPARCFAAAQWHGEPIAGKKILLHAEQGFGDTIQFVRYVPMVAALGAEVVLEVHPELVRLMQNVAGVSELIARGNPLPPFDLHCPLLSLPLAFDTTAETIPGVTPYLGATAGDSSWVKETENAFLRVGLVWSGSPTNQVDGKRSLAFGELEALFSVLGVKFYSFQRGGVELSPAQRERFEAVLPDAGDFAMTAAALGKMDLLITVDTALAHLGGALGLPVWMLLPYVSDWRWLRSGTGSAWYPQATLFRQTSECKWETVVLEVCEALRARVAHREALAKHRKGDP